MKDTSKSLHNKKMKDVIWFCDKSDCGHRNLRQIQYGYLIFDDKCDACDHMIHEPIVEDVKKL